MEILENLRRAIVSYDATEALFWANKAVEEGIDPIKALDALTEGIKQVGDGFGRGELFLPDLVMAGEAMKSAMPIFLEDIRRKGKRRKTLGKVVIGTVAGDIHDLGKNIVSTLLLAAGFEVIDLGVDVSVEKFVAAVKEHKPNILALSALLTMTVPEQRKIIEALKRGGLRDDVKIMVGGGPVTEEFAKGIDADGYEPTALDAVNLAKRLMRE